MAKQQTENLIVYQTEDGLTKIEVELRDETVWLSLDKMAELFQRDKSTVSRHIKNIFKEDELAQNSVVAFFATTASDGKTYQVEHFNLDVIISVGYRVKSLRGTQFRQWATKVLRGYMLHGYAVNQRFEYIERRLGDVETAVDFFVRTSLPPVEGVFHDGQIFDAYNFACKLVKSAKKRIALIDNYIDETVLSLLAKREASVSADIYTASINDVLQADINRHNAQYPAITVRTISGVHDRFLIIDDTVYHIGASIKDLGKKLFAFSKMEMLPRDILPGIF